MELFEAVEAKFQSTCPVWGTTLHLFRLDLEGQVSIHVPRVGHDVVNPHILLHLTSFNPRAPCGARRKELASCHKSERVSIHVPRVGHDMPENMVRPLTHVSIHVPRVGHDLASRCEVGEDDVSIHVPRVGHDFHYAILPLTVARFNPRAPCGARPLKTLDGDEIPKFQSTCPVWGTTIATIHNVMYKMFQSTCPVWGTTSGVMSTICCCVFQSTCPVWGTTGFT